METLESIHQVVQRLETNYTSEPSTISEFVEYSQFDNNNRIEAYLSSKHTSGDKDALERDKPFYNLCLSAVNIWYRATKRRLRDIKIRATKEGDTVAATMATVLLRDWGNKNKFEPFLVQWGMTLAAYGSSITKFIDRGDELDFSVVKWGNVISDNIDFYNNPVVEKFYLSRGELLNHPKYNKVQAKLLLDDLSNRKTLGGKDMDSSTDHIELYEVHGIFPLSYITGKEKDEEKYEQQMHVISFTGSVENKDWKEFTLIKGREEQSPYLLTNLLPDPTGQRATGRGAVELLFDAQWMKNHSMKLIKDQLDLASKIIFQTADEAWLGKNSSNAIETGDILIHAPNMPLTQLNNNSHDITSLQNFGADWNVLSQSLSSTPEAMRGDTPPSGTAYRTQQLAVNESHSLFDEMGYNKDIALEEMYRRFIIPFTKRKMDTTDEISSILEDNEIKKIDSKFVKNKVATKVNKDLIFQILEEGKMPTQEDQANMVSENEKGLQSQLTELGNQRFFKPSDIDSKTWKESLKNFEWDVEIDTPSDQKDINLVMETLTNLFQTLANPVTAEYAKTPMGKFLFNKIITMTGAVSPLEISDIEASQDMIVQAQTAQATREEPSLAMQPQLQPQMTT